MNTFKKTFVAMCMAGMMSACGSAEESSARYLENGIELVAAGETEKAKLEFRNAVQINPLEAEAYYQMGLLDEKAQNWRGMYANMTTVESLDPNHVGAIVKLGQIELLSDQLEKANERADKAITLDPENINAILLKATVLIKQKDFAAAEAEINKVLATDATNIEALSTHILMHKEMERFDLAIEGVNKALDIHPDAMPLKMVKLEILSDQKDYAAMENLYRELLPEFPNDRWVHISLAKLLNDVMDRHEDAKTVIENFLAANPDDVEMMLANVSLARTQGTDAAITLLDSYIEKLPEEETLRFAKIELLEQKGDRPSMNAELEALVRSQPETETGLKSKAILAGFEANAGNREKAEQMADEVLAIASEQEEALTLKSKLQLSRGEFDEAISNLRIVTRNNPESDEALVLIAQAYARTGSSQLAESSFRRALTLNPTNVDAALAVAGLTMQSNDLQRTETVLEEALKGKNAQNEELLTALTEVKLMRQDWAGAEQSLNNLNAINTNSAVGHLLSAQMYQGIEDNTLAISEYEQALEVEPTLTQALQGLAGLHMTLEQDEAAIDYLTQHIQDHPDLTNGYLVLANYHRQQENYDQAIEVTQQGMEQNPDWTAGYNLIANMYATQGEQQRVQQTYERAVEAFPEDNMLAMQLASSHEQLGNYEQAMALYEGVLERDPSQNIAANNLASLLSDQFESAENLQRAMTIVERFRESQQPYFADTYGWVQYKLGNYQEARPAIERAVVQAGEVAIFHYHLAQVYQALGLQGQAETSKATAQRLATEQNDEIVLEKLAEMD